MTCPNCYCVECAKERAKWVPSTFIPHMQPYVNIPAHPPGWWQCSCGSRHPPGYFCTQISGVGASFNPKPYLNPNS
jgi:hypothetical protein